MLLSRLRKLRVAWKSAHLKHRRPATMHECMHGPPEAEHRIVGFMIIVLVVFALYVSCIHFGDKGFFKDVEIVDFVDHRREVPCRHDCNFDALSKKMKQKIVETFTDVPLCDDVNIIGIGDQRLNEGRLFNVGFEQAGRFGSWGCLVFHDLNLLPIDKRILYTCPTFPRHMSATVLGHQNDSKYERFGGVTSLNAKHFLKVNGYSNDFWGCCGISSDMFWRIRLMGLRVVPYDKKIAKYLVLPSNPLARNYTNSSSPRVPATHKTSLMEDGLTTLRYKVLSIRVQALFTHILVNVNTDSKELNTYSYKYTS